MSPCILYQNPSAIVTLLDIPCSIELAQGFSPTNPPRLLSSKALEHSYPPVEPKSVRAKANVVPTSIEDLLLQKHLEFALDEVETKHEGLWVLPRVTVDHQAEDGEAIQSAKRQKLDLAIQEGRSASTPRIEGDHVVLSHACVHFHNSKSIPIKAMLGPTKEKVTIPPKSTFLQGDIFRTLNKFKNSAPKFDLVILDPPWPNRSARRKQSYSISYGVPEIRSLLSSIPLYDHLPNGGLVGVWVTNKPAFREMLVGEGGLFEEWGVQLIEEWIWLKVTSNGEPICALDSTWRKPYEVLLVGWRGRNRVDGDVTRQVIVGVPDLHSRKPNLRVLFEGMMGKGVGEYEALEVFARNLTEGWWSWGNEVLKFQMEEHWAEH